MSSSESDFVCITCGALSSSLCQEYSETVLKLTRCDKCGNITDKYIEYDVVLVILDLLLQNVTAYRHVLFNGGLQSYWRLAVIFTLCDAYHKWIERRSLDFPDQSPEIYDLEWRFYWSLLRSTMEMAVFVMATIAISRFYSKLTLQPDPLFFIKALLAGFYGNVVVVLAIIWQMHLSWSYLILTRLFIFISHVQILRALKSFSITHSIIIVTIATLSQFSVGCLLSKLCP